MSPNASLGLAYNSAEEGAGFVGASSPDAVAARLKAEGVRQINMDASPQAFAAHLAGRPPPGVAQFVLAPIFQLAAAAGRQGLDTLKVVVSAWAVRTHCLRSRCMAHADIALPAALH